MLSAPILLTAALAACLWPTDYEGAVPGLSMDPQAPPVDTTLPPSADTYTWHPHANDNFGTTTQLRTGAGGYGRAFLRWDPQAIQNAVGSMTLLMARVEITVQTSTGWSGSGGQVGLYRMTKDWTELGATDNCAIDAVPGNGHPDCSGATAWNLHDPGEAPWAVPATDSVPLTNGQTGTVTFDVTADVAAFLAGTVNHGWVVKPTNDGVAADVRFGSRENANPPMLVLTVTADTGRPPVPDGFTSPDSAIALLVSPPGQPELLALRNFIHIRFDDTTSGTRVRAILAKYNAEVMGGYPQTGVYVVRIPDPGQTYAALDSILAAVVAEPGVANAYRRVKRAPVEQLARYPSDGPQGQREDWLNGGSAATRALVAIRAPLSWGCETGRYTTPPTLIGVGVIDDVFDVGHPDLSSSDTTVKRLVGEILSDSLGPYARSHGTGVVGIVAAEGNNGSGTVGLVWGANLHLFEIAREVSGITRRVEDIPSYLANVVLPAARAAPIRILHSSITAPADPRAARDIAWQLERFVNADPLGRLFVQAAGNDRVTFSPSDADTLTKGGWLMQQAVVSLVGSPSAGRAILVSAADRDGDAIWVDDVPGKGATLWTGATDILAPGEDVLVLARTADFPAGTALVDGSSFAAPMVTGVAAQLLAFDAALTADEVKGYILAGASERINALGELEPVPAIPNSGGLHLLDAYGALARVARERPGTPVCGFPVYARDGQLWFERTPGTASPLPLAGLTPSRRVTVAQGGRRLAVASDSGLVQFDHLGTRSGTPLTDVAERIFLESDTADVLGARRDTLRIRHGSGQPATLLDLRARLAPTFPEYFGLEVAVSPAGDWAGVSAVRLDPDTAAFRWDYGWWLLSLAGADTYPIAVQDVRDTLCSPDCWLLGGSGTTGWTADGQRVVFALPQGNVDNTVLRTALANVTFPGGVPTGTSPTIPLAGLELVWPRFGPDAALLVVNELDTGQCYLAGRAATDPATVLLPRTARPAADCERGQDPRRPFNTPAALIAAERH